MLLKTEILCAELWEGHKAIQLPRMQEGDPLFLSFTMPRVSRIKGLFVVERRLDMYDTADGGYVQRLALSLHADTRKQTLEVAQGGLPS